MCGSEDAESGASLACVPVWCLIFFKALITLCNDILCFHVHCLLRSQCTPGGQGSRPRGAVVKSEGFGAGLPGWSPSSASYFRDTCMGHFNSLRLSVLTFKMGTITASTSNHRINGVKM